VEKIINAFMDEFQKNIPPALFELKEVINAHVRSTAETIIHKMDLSKIEESVKEMIEHANVSEKRNAQMKKTTPQSTSQAREIRSKNKVNTSEQTKKRTTTSAKTRKASDVEKSEKSKKVVATKKSTRKKTTNKNSD
jgi:hypothetical protein